MNHQATSEAGIISSLASKWFYRGIKLGKVIHCTFDDGFYSETSLLLFRVLIWMNSYLNEYAFGINAASMVCMFLSFFA
jgi:hypothetical protein